MACWSRTPNSTASIASPSASSNSRGARRRAAAATPGQGAGARSRRPAARINAEWTRNPLEIELVAPFGRYLKHDAQLSSLELGIVVQPRAPSRRARWGRFTTKPDGARDMRNAFRELSSFIRVHMVNDKRLLPRPFAVVFQER